MQFDQCRVGDTSSRDHDIVHRLIGSYYCPDLKDSDSNPGELAALNL